MAVINLAYTGNVNPEGASPKLTEEQIWAALQRKVRRGQDFVPVIEATTVVKEERANEKNYPHVPAGMEVVVREAKFTPGNGPAEAQMNNGIATETCVLYPPQRVDFLGATGSFVANVVSQGPGGLEDLRMTYTFSWQHPELDEVKDKVAVGHIRGKYQEQAKGAVENTLKSIRKMVTEGNVGDYEVVRK